MGGYGFMSRYQRNPAIRGFLGYAGTYAARRLGNYLNSRSTAVVPYRKARRLGGYKKKASADKKELKSVDYFLPVQVIPASVNTNASVYFINGVQPGTGFYNRIGRYQYVKSINIKLALVYDFKGDPSQGPEQLMYIPNVRFIVVHDRISNAGPAPDFNDMFLAVDSTGATASSVQSPPNLRTQSRFRVLRDVWLKASDSIPYMQPISNGAPVNSSFHQWREYTDYIKCNITTLYSGASDDLGSVESGAIYVILRQESDYSLTQNGYWQVGPGSVVRTRYTD